jgi:Family of unknown function (DUF5681)
VKDPMRPSSTSGEYTVGYGRPPQHTRFQPSRSGNPKGRAKSSKNLSTLFSEELAQNESNGHASSVERSSTIAELETPEACANLIRA